MIELNDTTFDDAVAGSNLPVLVEFTAEWCPPCRAIAPVLEEIATELAGELVVASLDVDRNPAATRRHDVTAMPTMIYFSGGIEQRRLVGARGKGRLLAELAELAELRPVASSGS